MKRLFLFYPQNDVALAADTASFTAPRAAVELQRSGELLPLWMCSAGDCVMCSGVSEVWLREMQDTFGLTGEVWNHSPEEFVPLPWGWSKASRNVFIHNGYSADALPSDARLEHWRELSHRRTAARLCELVMPKLSCDIYPPAVEISSVDELRSFIANEGIAVVKSPWSSSGRGVRIVDERSDLNGLEGTLRKHGSLMVEKYVNPHFDFALLYNARGTGVDFVGYSLFETRGTAYQGNLVAPQDVVASRIVDRIGSAALDEISAAVSEELKEILAGSYEGPVGVDMLCDETGMMHIVEINLRCTMGFVALALARYVDGVAMFSVRPEDVRSAYTAAGGKLTSGTLALTPPGNTFSFLLRHL